MREELKNIKTSDPKEYWKILNRGRERKTTRYSYGRFVHFFKKI
jgi:hypothetical protein